MSEMISIIIPIYNDIVSLSNAVEKSIFTFERLGNPFEIILSIDVGDDGSYEFAKSLCFRDSRFKLDYSLTRRGKGGAIVDAIMSSNGDIICFYDVDLATDLSVINPLIKAIQSGADIAIGSRNLPLSITSREKKRDVISKIFLYSAQIALGSAVTDYQCGCKAFKKVSILKLIPYSLMRGWTWDTEILALAQQSGCLICEIPVIWKESENTTLKFRDAIRMGFEIFLIGWRVRILKKHP